MLAMAGIGVAMGGGMDKGTIADIALCLMITTMVWGVVYLMTSITKQKEETERAYIKQNFCKRTTAPYSWEKCKEQGE